MSFRLCIINPNSDETVTAHLREQALRVLPAGSAVEALTCADSPLVIETADESATASLAVLEAAREASAPDAFFVGCFGGPGVDRVRAETGLPVVGLGEAALLQASLLCRRFGLVTTLEIGVGGLWDQVGRTLARERCAGIVAANSDGGDDDAEPLLVRLQRAGRRLLADGADGIVLACASFSPEAVPLGASLGVGVYDGVGLAPGLAHALWAAGTASGVGQLAGGQPY